MEGRKDISDKSFEEFFSKEGREPMPRAEPQPRRQRPSQEQKGEVPEGFGPATPKMNCKDGRFFLYIPRYGSDSNARFEVAIDCGAGVIPLGRLDSAPRGSGRMTRTATLDLTDTGVTPIDSFTLIIDGKDVFRYRGRDLVFFNNIGLPLGRPVGEVYAVHPAGKPLRTVKTEVLDSVSKGRVSIDRLDVSTAGGVWLDDRKPRDASPEVPSREQSSEPKEEASVQDAVAEAPKAKPKPRKKAKGALKMPTPIQEADVSVGGRILPIYVKMPAFTVSVENCEPDECTVVLTDLDGNQLAGGGSPARGPTVFETDSQGPMRIVLEKGGQKLASTEFALIPDFQCGYSGKGDIPAESVFQYTAMGETGEADAYGGMSELSCGMAIRWYVPALTFDYGSGEQRHLDASVDVDDMGDTLVVTVTGARKKALFIGGEKGKKRELSQDWTEDTCRIPLDAVKQEIYSAPSSEFAIFITVNSCPMRRMVSIHNPVRMEASYGGGEIHVRVASTGTFVCRLFRLDKTVETVQLESGESTVPVSPDVIEAEVAEIYGGGDRSAIQIRVRDLPFLLRDELGDVWLYVSRSKRIPLPDGLVSNGKPDLAKVRAWHEQIVRMNPELRAVTPAMMQKAFTDMGW